MASCKFPVHKVLALECIHRYHPHKLPKLKIHTGKHVQKFSLFHTLYVLQYQTPIPLTPTLFPAVSSEAVDPGCFGNAQTAALSMAASSQGRHADPSTLLAARTSSAAVAAAADAVAELRNLSRQASRLQAAAEATGMEAWELCQARTRVQMAASVACKAAQMLEETAPGTEEARASRAAADVATAADATAVVALESAMEVAEAANALFQASRALVESAAAAAEAAEANATGGATLQGSEVVGTAAPAPVVTAAADVNEGAPFQAAAEAAEAAHSASSSPVPTPLLRTRTAADVAALTADSTGGAVREVLDPLPDPGVSDNTPEAVPAGHCIGTNPAAPVLPPEYGVEPHTLIPNPDPSEAQGAAASPLFSRAVSGADALGPTAAGTAPLPVKTATARKVAQIFSTWTQSWRSSSPGVSAGGAKAKRSGGGTSSAGSHNVAAAEVAAGESQPPPDAENLSVPARAQKGLFSSFGAKFGKLFHLRKDSASSGNADAAARAVTSRDVDRQQPVVQSSDQLASSAVGEEGPAAKIMCMVKQPCGLWVLSEQLPPVAVLVEPVLSWQERARRLELAPDAAQSVPDDTWGWGMIPPSWHVSTVRVRSNIYNMTRHLT